MPRRLLAIVWLVLGAVIAACGSETFVEIEKDRAPLIDGLESYAGREEALAKAPRGPQRTVVEDTSRHKDAQPPYRVYAVKLAGYEHLRQRGDLLITFFNDRLMQTAFYPEDLDAYVGALRASGVAAKTGSELKNGHTAIWIGKDFDNKSYVGWADERLRAQQRRWLSRYS